MSPLVASLPGPSLGPALLATTLIVPAFMLAMCLWPRSRPAVPRLLALAPLPALATALLCPPEASIVFDEGRLDVTLALGRPGALLLGLVALLWILAGAYTSWAQRDDPRRVRFAVAWLLSLLGCVGVFITADLASFYLLFAVVSLSAFGLVVHDGTPKARRAAMVYVALAIFGEACLVVGFVLLALADPGQSLRIDEAVAALPTFRLRDQTMVFLLMGFGLKAGLVPLHAWLPLAHPAAPAPGSAVLSGAIIKTGIIGLVVFMPPGAGYGAGHGAWCAGWGEALAALGMLTALYCVAVGVTQENVKTILAYSSASQMGLVAAVIGLGMMGQRGAGPAGLDASGGAAMVATFAAGHHVLVKGALFLGVGLLAAGRWRSRTAILVVMAVLGLSFAGLPGTGGSLVKQATAPNFDTPLLKALATLSAMGSALLMVRFMARLSEQVSSPKADGTPTHAAWRIGLLLPWAACAAAALVLPWLLCRAATGMAPLEALAPAAVWSALWPVGIGAAAGVALQATRLRLPSIPEGDVIVPAEAAVRSAVARACVVEPFERFLALWWVAGLVIAALVLALTGLG